MTRPDTPSSAETRTRGPRGIGPGLSNAPVLLNANARAFRDGTAAEVTRRVAEACRAAGLHGPVRVVSPAAFDRAIRAAVDQGADTVVVGGGDGTVRTAAQVLAGTEVAIGVLPLGTLNHYARDLGMPEGLAEAARALAGGEVRGLDVGDLDGSVFVNTSSLGLYPYLVRVRDQGERRRRFGKVLALIPAAWRTFWRFPILRVRIDTARGEDLLETPLVFVGNNEYVLGPNVGTRAQLDHGVLYLCAVTTTNRWRFLWLCVRSLFVSAPSPTVTCTHVLRSFSIDLPYDHAWVSLDGEVRRVSGRLHYRVRPHGLRVVVPRKPEAAA